MNFKYLCKKDKILKKNHIIAIDGYSSTGKSTLAKKLAKALNFIYIDTGAMYRAITYYALKNHLISDRHFDKEKLIKLLDRIKIEFKTNPDTGHADVFLNGENIENVIRQMEVSNFVSYIAEIPEIRKKLVAEQRKIAQNKSVVMDGRDIGSVVFPHADLKLFMTASPEIRAERRFTELKNKGLKVNFNEVLENIKSRDKIDTEREDSPLIKTDDAIEIDNDHLNQQEVFEKVMQLIKEKQINPV